MRTSIVIACTTAALAGNTALGASGLVKDLTVEGIHQEVLKIRSGIRVEFAFEGGNDPGTAPVVEVFTYPGGAPVAHTLPGGIAVIPPAPAERTMTMIVRGQPGSSAGSVRLTTRVFVNDRRLIEVTKPVSIEPVPAHVLVGEGLPARSHVLTVEQQDGPADTLLLVYPSPSDSETFSFSVKLDDDNGVAAMSWMHLDQACNDNGCAIVVGRRTNTLVHDSPVKNTVPAGGKVTLIWDSEIHVADRDRDGLGDELESMQLGTNPDLKDTDGDGINDAFEVIGKDDPPAFKLTSLLKFPFYGANPRQKDIFIEADWAPACLNTQPNCTPTIKNGNRFSAQEAFALRGKFFPDFDVHMDTGTPNLGSTNSGDWGGAQLTADGTPRGAEYCVGWSPERKGLFRHGLATGGAQSAGMCFQFARSRPGASAHEIGHHLGLSHWGTKAAGPANCKPNYLSIMSYMFQDHPQFGGLGQFNAFSRGTFLSRPLNPFAVSETTGLGTTDLNVLSLITNSFGRAVNTTTGSIDWNQDGRNEASTFAMLNSAPGRDCDPGPSTMRGNWAFTSALRPSLTDEGERLRFWAVFPGGIMTATTDVIRCEGKASNRDSEFEPCTGWTNAGVLQVNPGAGLFTPQASGDIVVYADTRGNLRFLRRDAPQFGGRFMGPSAPVGGPAVQGNPALIEAFGLVRVYAVSGGVLRRWDWDTATKRWITVGAIESWHASDPVSPGAAVNAQFGVGVTRGFTSDFPDPADAPGVYAAIPATDAMGVPRIELARLISTEVIIPIVAGPFRFDLRIRVDGWRRYPAATWTAVPGSGQPVAFQGPPGLAYRAFNNRNPTVGRFYLAFTNQQTARPITIGRNTFPRAEPQITFTRGNTFDPTTPVMDGDRRLVWVPSTRFKNVWEHYPSGVTLLNVLGTVRAIVEQGVGSSATVGTRTSFFPAADGIANVDMRDNDDVDVITRNLKCSLTQCSSMVR
jgi:hypothetical protein